ncbi:hypothetical protein OF83DRAFT_1030283, partial [Amylostereum chailletii]
DPCYGQGQVANAHFISHLFAYPELSPAGSATTAVPSTRSTPPSPTPCTLAEHGFISPSPSLPSTSVTFTTLYHLQRLKAHFPAAKSSSGHRIFISAFMVASKIICDDTHSNKSRRIAAQGMFALREINQMEQEVCSYLEGQLNVDTTVLREFETRVRRGFSSVDPYP